MNFECQFADIVYKFVERNHKSKRMSSYLVKAELSLHDSREIISRLDSVKFLQNDKLSDKHHIENIKLRTDHHITLLYATQWSGELADNELNESLGEKCQISSVD